MKIKVSQGSNNVESVYIEKNEHGIVTVIINTEQRWCDYTTGSSHMADGESTDDVYISPKDDQSGKDSVVSFESKTLDGLISYTVQEKDQIISTYIPLEFLRDGDILAEWEK